MAVVLATYETRIDPRTNLPREYRVTKTYGKVKARDAHDKTVGEAINQMESGIRLSATLNASSNHFRGLFG